MKISASTKGLLAIAAGIFVVAILWTAAAELFFVKETSNFSSPKLDESVIVLVTENLNQTLEYYTNTFNSNNNITYSDEGNSEFASIIIDNVKFLIITSGGSNEINTSHLKDEINSGNRKYYIYSSNIDSLYKLIEEKVIIISQPKFIMQNLRSFSIEDINGYTLTFLEDRFNQ
ncbi:MAG: hypothetical protein PHW27_02070 [Melioribacteraceae bacterium]|nr:hypothetical protein [Melioribacteraceae bacterium]MDD3557335.1 hypothetical protein [Melioribacteraceae bacterium]